MLGDDKQLDAVLSTETKLEVWSQQLQLKAFDDQDFERFDTFWRSNMSAVMRYAAKEGLASDLWGHFISEVMSQHQAVQELIQNRIIETIRTQWQQSDFQSSFIRMMLGTIQRGQHRAFLTKMVAGLRERSQCDLINAMVTDLRQIDSLVDRNHLDFLTPYFDRLTPDHQTWLQQQHTPDRYLKKLNGMLKHLFRQPSHHLAILDSLQTFIDDHQMADNPTSLKKVVRSLRDLLHAYDDLEDLGQGMVLSSAIRSQLPAAIAAIQSTLKPILQSLLGRYGHYLEREDVPEDLLISELTARINQASEPSTAPSQARLTSHHFEKQDTDRTVKTMARQKTSSQFPPSSLFAAGEADQKQRPNRWVIQVPPSPGEILPKEVKTTSSFWAERRSSPTTSSLLDQSAQQTFRTTAHGVLGTWLDQQANRAIDAAYLVELLDRLFQLPNETDRLDGLIQFKSLPDDCHLPLFQAYLAKRLAQLNTAYSAVPQITNYLDLQSPDRPALERLFEALNNQHRALIQQQTSLHDPRMGFCQDMVTLKAFLPAVDPTYQSHQGMKLSR